MPRLHLFELEDQPWFPSTIRDFATDYLRFLERRFALHRPAVPLVAKLLRATGATHIVDLCSGAAGPIPGLLNDLQADGLTPQVTLTDRFPNVGAFQRTAKQSSRQISFWREPVDARWVPPELSGVRTLFNSFHHFCPSDALAVLRNAAQHRQPIGIFEIPERSFRTLIPLLVLTPFLVAIATPFIRPFRWQRLLWTYLLPLVPLTSWWDGVVSQLRAYTADELQRLGKAAEPDAYVWSAGRVPIGSVPGYLTFLIGYPRDTEEAAEPTLNYLQKLTKETKQTRLGFVNS